MFNDERAVKQGSIRTDMIVNSYVVYLQTNSTVTQIWEVASGFARSANALRGRETFSRTFFAT